MGRRVPIRLLLAALATIAVAPLLAVVTVGLVNSYQAARTDARMLAEARANAVTADLDSQIAGIDNLMRTISQIAGFSPADSDSNSAMLRTIKASLPPWYANIILLTPEAVTAGVAEGNAAQIAPAGDREYFQRALQQRGLVSGVPTVSRATGAPVIHLARPVLDAQGGLRGVVAVSLHLDRLQELIDTSPLPAGSVITLVSQEGHVIARSDDPQGWVGQDVGDQASIRRILAQDRGSAEMPGLDGRTRLYAFATLDQVPWHLAAGIPFAATFAPIRDDLRREVALLVLALVLTTAGVAIVGRYITIPITRTAAAARLLTSGDWSIRAPVTGPEELRSLAQALNRLADTTEAHIAGLRQREAQMGGIVSSAMDAIITVDEEQQIIVFNGAAEEMFACLAEEALGGSLARFLPARIRDRHQALVGHFGETGVTRRSMEHLEPLTAVRTDGSEFPIEATISQTVVAGRRQFTVILRDITERVRAEAERQRLLQGERAAREAAESTALQLRGLQSVTDAALSSLSLQDLLGELPGRVREALQVDTVTVLLADTAGELLVTRAVAGLDIPLDRSLHVPLGAGFAGRVAQERRPIVLEDDAAAHLIQPEFIRAGLRSLLGVPLLAHGRVLGVLHAGSRTPRRFSEEDTALLTLAAERMAIAFEHARLFEAEQQARAEAQSALSMRDEFLSAVSHELRTPLTTIVGFAQVLARRVERMNSDSRAALREGLSSITVNAQRMTALVTDLLDVSRLQSGRGLALELEPLNLDALVDSAVSEARLASPQHTFTFDLPDEPLSGNFDQARLGRAISNILVNAIKYSPGGGEITVGLSAAGGEATLTVTDQGIGIPADDLPLIFERFHRGGNVGGIWGAGIGLSLVRQIVEQHGGEVQIASAPDSGTTVTIRLPLQPAITA